MMVYSCSEGEEPCKPTPTLTTKEAKDINDTSATLIGEIIAPTCDKTVTSQGFVYSETILPKITDNVIEVSGVDISKQINSLKQNKTYYYRTFFTNPIGTFYGNEVTFTTQVGSAILNATSISNITAISATASSNVIGAGEGQITKRGVCWSTNQNPTTADNKTENGTGIGQFSSELTNLKADTTYYLRTYATNEAGTTYGNEVSFKTRDGVILLTTKQISNITIDSAMSGGNITNDGGAEITTRGVCWSINQNPTTADSKTEDGTGIGQFNSELKNLAPNTTYYIRAYAISIIGTFYGQEINMQIETNQYDSETVFCDSKITKIVEITSSATGKKWMDRNLGASYAPQDLPSGTNYENDVNVFGDLYQWGRRADGHQCRNSSTINVLSSSDKPAHGNFIIYPQLLWQVTPNANLWQGLNGVNNPCPKGYRLPTQQELANEMKINFNGGNLKLPRTSGLRTGTNGSIVTNTLFYWTSTVVGLNFSGALSGDYRYNAVDFGGQARITGGSVRCIKH